ncbi:MAG: hypothetical protein HQM02_09660 [Magnetococcales bacterium]|nr:hypothetical protein [Magnetococcales bacterium]
MSDDKNKNIVYFRESSMEDLYNTMLAWQGYYGKGFISTDTQRDGDFFCCIALTNPEDPPSAGKDGGKGKNGNKKGSQTDA